MINYREEASKYRPRIIKKLLIAESPPPSGKTYFYLPKVPVRNSSLPATIFKHYFNDSVPKTEQEYESMLRDLQKKGIFLIDISDEPLKIRDNNYPGGVNPQELKKLLKKIPRLRAVSNNLKGTKDNKVVPI